MYNEEAHSAEFALRPVTAAHFGRLSESLAGHEGVLRDANLLAIAIDTSLDYVGVTVDVVVVADAASGAASEPPKRRSRNERRC